MRPALFGLLLAAALIPGAGWSQNARQVTPGRYAFNIIKKGATYASVRADLLAAGNIPDYHTEKPEERCIGRANVCRAYPETEDCSGSGRGFCIFNWTAKEGGHYSIVTAGDLSDGLPVDNVSKQ